MTEAVYVSMDDVLLQSPLLDFIEDFKAAKWEGLHF
jgi:hypothetical protein